MYSQNAKLLLTGLSPWLLSEVFFNRGSWEQGRIRVRNWEEGHGPGLGEMEMGELEVRSLEGAF